MRPTAGWRILVAVFLLGLFASSARAGDPAVAPPTEPGARQHFVLGNRLYRIRKFEAAIVEYQKGAVIAVAPVFDYNLGQCYRQLGKYTDAIWHYERFLTNGRPGPELHALVTGFLRQMRAELERKAMTQPPTEVAVETSPPRTAQRDPPSASRAASPSPVVRGDAQWYSDRLGWGLVAGGSLGGGIATYLLVSAANLRADVGTTTNEERRIELRDASRTRGLAGAAVGIGGAALIAAGMVKLAVHRAEQPQPSALTWGVAASAHGAFVFGRF